MTAETNLGRVALALVAAVGMAATAAAQGSVTQPKQGQGGTVVQGSAGTGGAKAPEGLQTCEKPMGAVAVVEPQSEVITHLARYNLTTPVPLIRMMIQQSNCFIVVERGAGMRNAMQERQLAAAGETRADSNMGTGQMMTADFVLTPNVVFADSNAGGMGAAVGGMFGRTAAAVAGGLKFKEAQTSMLLSDTRSSVQVAAAEGSTKKADIRLGAGLFGGGAGGGAGGYGSTNEGKIIAAALMDNYNNLVLAVRNDPSLQRNVGTLKQEAAKGAVAGRTFQDGEVITPKIGNVPLRADASDTSKQLATLPRGEEMIVVGPERDGFVKVQTAAAEGWVKLVLVQRR